MTNRINLLISIFIAFVICAILSCSSTPNSQTSNSVDSISVEEDYRNLLETSCALYNDSLPKTLKDGTIMKSCKLNGYSMLYVIEVQNLSKEELRERKSVMSNNMVNMLAISFDLNRSVLKLMRNEGFDFAFKYVDQDGRFLMKINISPKNILEVLDDGL